MSSSRPPSHYYTNSMNSQGSYERYQTAIDIPNPPDFQRRIWVKISNGNPTTILISPDDLIDDLKSLIILKYPNSLGKTWDSADLVIKLDYNKGLDKKQNLSVSPDKSGHGYNFNNMNVNNNSNNINNHSNSNSNPTFSPMNVPNKFITLESDQNIFTILDNYYPHGMTMYEALIIEHPPKGYTDIPCFQPKPQYNINTKLMKERSISPSLNNTSQLSPILQTKQSPLASGAAIHRRSQSNPPQSPASQAVLLLPKNFSLTGNESKKNDDDKDDKFGMFSKRLPSTLPKINTEDLSTEDSTTNEPIKKSLGLQVLKSNQKLASPSRTPISPNQTNNNNNNNNNNNDINNDNNDTNDNTSHSNSTKDSKSKLIKKSDSKSIKSTTEKVLPSISVLVVEDNAINQAILGAFLRKHKIHYQIAKNGQEAIDKWRMGGFHLILMDIQLPIKSGIEATKEIRHLEKINQIGVFDKSELINNQLYELTQQEKLDINSFRSPVIIVALTASSNSSVDRQNALMAGCNDYLTKPVNLVWLQNKITEWGCMQALIDFDGWKVKSLGLGNNKAKENKDKDMKMLSRKQIAT